MSYYIFAETAFHHEGDIEYLKKLIDAASESGVKGVKFQVLIELDEFISIKSEGYEFIKSCLLSFEQWKEVFSYALSLNLDVILMPLDTKAFELTHLFPVKYIEIHSVSFNDKVLFQELEKYPVSLILGIGGRTYDEIYSTVKQFSDREMILMVGFQAFPSELRDVKLTRIFKLAEMFKSCTIGYADHSAYNDEMSITSSEYAYVLGARVFEKHITLNEGVQRTDFDSAIGVKGILKIISRLNKLESLRLESSTDVFEMSEKELNYRNRQKIPVAKVDMKKDSIITVDDLVLKIVSGHKDSLNRVDDLVGKQLMKNISKDSPFQRDSVV